jgi:hypothetical protein
MPKGFRELPVVSIVRGAYRIEVLIGELDAPVRTRLARGAKALIQSRIPGCPSLTGSRTSTGLVLSTAADEAKGTTNRDASTESNATVRSGSAPESPSVDLPVPTTSTLEIIT